MRKPLFERADQLLADARIPGNNPSWSRVRKLVNESFDPRFGGV